MDELDRYPSPHVAVDVVPLTCANGELRVLLLSEWAGQGRALPGRFLRPRERLHDGVREVLREKTGITTDPSRATWLGFFDDPSRDRRGWTISAAFVLGLPARDAEASLLRSSPVRGDTVDGGPLAFDHGEIVQAALVQVRGEYEQYPDPRGFLDRPFTLTELREVHEAVLGEPLLRDTFRRRMEPMLRRVDGEVAMPAGVGRPAQLYVVDGFARKANPRVMLPRAEG